MSTNTNYRGPKIAVPLTMPVGVPANLQPVIKPLYLGLQSLVQTLVRYAGIGPRNQDEYLYIKNDPTTVLANNMHRFYATAGEDIPSQSLVNFYDDGFGLTLARLADANDPLKYCNAFYPGATQPLATGSIDEFIVAEGVLLLPVATTVISGAKYFLSDTVPGSWTDTAPVGAGKIEQMIGFGLSKNAIKFGISAPIQL